ncbi:MAG: glycosyltransferase [Solirubrobacterales bacterium]|nr:glycosyltransferase [Solirubrobacterales bacterium]
MSAAPRVLVVHNRYRIEGGEERSVDLQLAALEAAGVDHASFERRSADAGRARAAAAMLRGGDDPAELAAAVRLLAAGDITPDRAGRADPAPPNRGRRSGEIFAGTSTSISAAAPGPVIVHAHNTVPLVGPAGLAAARAAGARVVLHLHNVRIFCATGFGERDGAPCRLCTGRHTLPGLRHNCRDSLAEAAVYAAALSLHQPRLLDAVDRFVAPSAAARDELAARGLDPGRVEVLRHYLPAELFAERSAAGEGRYALIASRLSPEKGIEDAVRACVAAGVPLRVAGEGPERARLERLARELGAGGAQVAFLGRLPADALARELAGAAMVLMPSRYHEFSPYSALEAMAAGVPVAATAMGGLPELLGDGRCVPVGAVDEFAALVGALWSDPARRAEEGEALLARARERHSRAAYTDALLGLYGRLTASSATAA